MAIGTRNLIFDINKLNMRRKKIINQTNRTYFKLNNRIKRQSKRTEKTVKFIEKHKQNTFLLKTKKTNWSVLFQRKHSGVYCNIK